MTKYLLIMLVLLTASISMADIVEIEKQASKLAKQYDVDKNLILAIIKVESNFNPKAVGASHGEVGLMQLRPKYFPEASVNIRKNMEIGVKYLAKLHKTCYPKYKEAWFICYNLGPTKTIKHPKLFAYYKKVTNAKKALKNKTDRVRIASNIR